MSPGPACGDKGGLCGAARPRSIGMRRGSAPCPWHLSQGTGSGHRRCCQPPPARRKLGSITGPLCIPAPWLQGVQRIPSSRDTLQGGGDSLSSGKQHTKASCEGQGAAAPAAGPGAPGAPPSLWHQNNLPDHGASPSFPFLADTSQQKPGCASWEQHLGHSEGGANPSVSSWWEPVCQGSANQLPPCTEKYGRTRKRQLFLLLHMPMARTGTQTPPPAPQVSQNPKRGHEQRPIPAPALSSEGGQALPKPTQGSSRCFYFLSPLEPRSVSFLLSHKGAPSLDPGSPALCQAGRTRCPGSAGWGTCAQTHN